MKKFLIIIGTILLTVVTIALVYENVKYDKLEEAKVTDECIYEENTIEEEENNIKVSSAETKLSPNAELVIKKYYKDCGHTTKEIKTIPNDMVNRNQEEIEKIYTDYKLESFSNDMVVLYKEEEGQCNEHYIIKDEDSNIMIYKILSNGNEEIYQNTGISTEYLPETDKISLKNGLKVYGREKLNSIIEDFE